MVMVEGNLIVLLWFKLNFCYWTWTKLNLNKTTCYAKNEKYVYRQIKYQCLKRT